MSHSSSGFLQDEEIIQLYFSRNERAITETERRYGTACMKLSMDILESRPDAEECVNDTYLKAWNAIPPARPQSLCAYLLRIVRNLSISRLRELSAARRSRGATVSLSELEECIPTCACEDGQLTEMLNRFLGTLDETSRRLFIGRYWYNLPIKQLAADWEISPSSASRNLTKSRELLRTYLENGGYTV